ncbi:DnaJ C-terminal domain-containing protein [Streptomyces sp. NPDC048650]|uniref:caspase, EACC1-associated type n=1 Tax=unclassified Streptomyces TaxID=2593676 RepID=UPI003715F606
MTDSPLGPGCRDALLIATGTYDDHTLSTLRSPAQDCAGLADVLADPGIGAFRTEQVSDAPAHQAMRAIERFFLSRSRDDLLLLHVSCHGIKDDDGHLYFAARDTDRNLPASTAIPAAFLRDRMERCRARTIIVLLDCCYSGAFLPGAKGDGQIHVRDELSGHGRAVLTATNRTEYAWEGRHIESTAPQPSLFTGALIEGLCTGAADLNGDGRITVTELYDYVYESLHRAGVKQHPRIWADLEYQVTIARTVGAPVRDNPGAPLPDPPPQETAALSKMATRDSTEDSTGDSTGEEPIGAAKAPRPYAAVLRGQDALIRQELTLDETAFGTVKDITVDTAVLCSSCSGSGWGRARPRCEACHGRGEKAKAERDLLGESSDVPSCPTCQGRGIVGPCCPECDGNGRVPTRRTLTVKIPAGVDDGTRIQFAGEGEVGPGGGESADLYLEIVELPHRVFERIGDDLHCTISIPQATATTGDTVQLDTLDGTKTVRIPQGIRNGQALRLAELGATHLKVGDPGDILSADGRGDILLHIEICD